MGCIYRIFCKENGRTYIGQSRFQTPSNRYNRHWNDAIKNIDTPLYRAMRKYGRDGFEVELLFIGTNECLDNMECYFAEQYNSYIWENGFNAILCGKGVQRDINHSQKHKEHMSKLMTGRKLSDETKQKIREARTGQKCNLDDETRKRLAELSRKRATGVKHSDETKIKIGLAKKGKPSPLKGIPKSEEIKQKLKISRTGIFHTEETKQLMREKQREIRIKNPNVNKCMRYSEEDIQYIRTNPDNLSRNQLAEKFKTCFQNISSIVLRKTYKHIQ